MIKFQASLKRGKAIKIDNEGEVEVSLNIPASDLPAALKLTLMVGKAFNVEITEEAEEAEE